MRRTWLSETPSASNRFSMSLMRRVPSSGRSRLSAATASRFGSGGLGLRTGGTRGLGISASGPPSWYDRHQAPMVPTETPKMRDTSAGLAPRSSTSLTTLTLKVTGSHRGLTDACPAPAPLPVLEPPS
jgi:hypothetical protein